MKINKLKKLSRWCPQTKNPTLRLRSQAWNNFFNHKMTITGIAFITLIAVMGSSIVIQIYVPSLYHETYSIKARRLSQQPDTYFILENPDIVVSQAVLNPDEYVTLYSLEDTQIDELIDKHNTGNIRINDGYYWIGIVVGDSFPPVWLSFLYLASVFALPISAIVVALLATRFLLRKKNNAISGNH